MRATPDRVPDHQKRRPYPKADLTKLQEAVVILLGAHLGLRVSEMIALRRAEVHLGDEQLWLSVERGKGGKRREVSISRSAGTALARWLRMTLGLTEHVMSWRTGRTVERQALCERVGGLRFSLPLRFACQERD
ncbi:site-specific integrase (plasmid) [Deinococcus sp. KNUC1210]|uniref:site-specific integrase n=1 Tax=Deinococcus sp. KNUC1210 TaxID=2917691 RepID=UPI001EF01F73|nr:site-specific integrase [Deinococcus sp. KNUC1210]ULH18366.1 site-specific integrase [Deinococcus sp. KNUC1210]